MTAEEVNGHVAEYEACLRQAESDIEGAMRAICPLSGPGFPRYELGEALEKVQDAIRDAWRHYENAEDVG